jgi:hypothetical protein
MARFIGVFSPSNITRGVCSVAECDGEIAGALSCGSPVDGMMLCREHLDEYAETEVELVQES